MNAVISMGSGYFSTWILGWCKFTGNRQDPNRSLVLMLCMCAWAIVIGTFLRFGEDASLKLIVISIGMLLWCSTLMTLAMADWKLRVLPDILTKPFWLLGSITNLLFQIHSNQFASAFDAAIGLLAPWFVWGFMVAIGQLALMGRGDAKFLAGITAWLGWELLPQVLIMALAFSIFEVIFARINQERAGQIKTPLLNTPIAFGPALAFGTMCAAWFSPLLSAVNILNS